MNTISIIIVFVVLPIIAILLVVKALKKICKKPQPPMPHSKELCVCCWELTDESIDTPVDERKCYVDCIGQLCEKCYDKIYN